MVKKVKMRDFFNPEVDEAEILKFISSIRDSFEGAEIVYTKGSCYQFYKILKGIFPAAEAYYDMNHVITKIGDCFYDITGKVDVGGHFPMVTSETDYNEVKNNKYSLMERVSSLIYNECMNFCKVNKQRTLRKDSFAEVASRVADKIMKE